MKNFFELDADNEIETLDLCEVDELEPRSFVCDRLKLQKGTYVNIVGTGASCKSLILQAMALSFAAGIDLFNDPEFKVDYSSSKQKANYFRVLHLDQEQSKKITVERYVRIAEGYGINKKSIKSIDRKKLKFSLEELLNSESEEQNKAGRKYLVDLFNLYDVVVVDSLRQIISGDENSSELGIPLGELRSVAEETETTLIVIDHSGKASNTNVKQPGRGTTAKYDNAENIGLALSKYDEETQINNVELICSKLRVDSPWKKVNLEVLDGGDYMEKHGFRRQLIIRPTAGKSDQVKKDKLFDIDMLVSHFESEGNLSLNSIQKFLKHDKNEQRRIKLIDELEEFVNSKVFVKTTKQLYNGESRTYRLHDDYKENLLNMLCDKSTESDNKDLFKQR